MMYRSPADIRENIRETENFLAWHVDLDGSAAMRLADLRAELARTLKANCPRSEVSA
jgi:hypothetical protein